jgi:hypothetical protein
MRVSLANCFSVSPVASVGYRAVEAVAVVAVVQFAVVSVKACFVFFAE